MRENGIDVSYANGRVDWEKVRGSVDFAILRCGYGSDLASQDDEQWERNVTECIRLGIPWGVYLYSYAMTVVEARSEVAHVLRLLKGRRPVFPVFLDMEDSDGYKAKRGGLSRRMATDFCKLFCLELTAAGCLAGVYANKDWAVNRLYMGELSAFPFWLAQYNDEATYPGKYDLWQYVSGGTVPGVAGKVDMNYNYRDFSAGKAPGAALSLDTRSKDMTAGERYTVLSRCRNKPTVDVTGRDVIRVSEPRLDPSGRGWLIDVVGLPPQTRFAHITVTADSVARQCNFNVSG